MQDYLSRPVPPRVKNPETRLLAEYLQAKLAHYVSMVRVPLGPALIGEAGLGPNAIKLGAARPWRPEVDAVVLMVEPSTITMLPRGPRGVLVSAPATGTLLLIEAKVSAYLDGLAKLPFYRALVGSTPELEPLRGWELRMRLVICQDAPWVQIAAQVADVEVDIYDPPWMADYRQYRQRYWTKEWREERLRVNEIRKRLGL